MAVAAAELPFRGLNPNIDTSVYAAAIEAGTFTCLSGGAPIPASRINDDYCDCADGSDEPGTSACNLATFYCENKGYNSMTLFASRINDGVCDCCDGSDEFVGETTACPNTCKEDGAEYRKHLRERYEALKKGVEAKKKLQAEAGAIRAQKVAKAEELRESLSGAAKLVEEKTAAKEAAEEREKVEREQKLLEWEEQEDTRIAAVEEEIMAREASDEEDDEDGEGTVKVAVDDVGSSTVTSDSEAAAKVVSAEEMNKPPSQVMEEGDDDEEEPIPESVKLENFDMNAYPDGVDAMNAETPPEATPAVEPCVMWRQTGGCKSTGPREADSDKDCSATIPDGSSGYCECAEGKTKGYPCKHPSIVCEDVCTELIIGDAIGSNVELNDVDYEDEGDDADEDEDVETVDPLIRQTMPEWNSEEANAIREELKTAESEKSSVSRELITAEKELTTDYGEDDVWLAVFGKCAKMERNKYAYEVCLFGEAKQNDGTGSWLRLGSFDKWDENKAHRMHFTGGQKCWNGPDRSMYVDFQCGEKFELLTADEPEKCVYHLEAKLPAVCDDLRTEAVLKELSDMS